MFGIRKIVKEINTLTLGENELLWVFFDGHVRLDIVGRFIGMLKERIPEEMQKRIVYSSDFVHLHKVTGFDADTFQCWKKENCCNDCPRTHPDKLCPNYRPSSVASSSKEEGI